MELYTLCPGFSRQEKGLLFWNFFLFFFAVSGLSKQDFFYEPSKKLEKKLYLWIILIYTVFDLLLFLGGVVHGEQAVKD